MKFIKKYWPKISLILLGAVCAIVVLARYWQLGKLPGGIHADEASYGYDALSLVKTSKDQWGQRLPLVFKSFGEYKLNLPYLIAPAVAWRGLNTTATRLPSAIAGLLTCVILYFTLNLLFKNPKLNAILTLIFATSPWSFGISRLFFESNVSLFFLSFGAYAILRSNRGYSDRLFDLGIISLGLAGYFYAPYRFVALGIITIYLLTTRKLIFRTLIIFLLTIMPILPQYFSGVGLSRLKQESVARSFEYSLVINENRDFCNLSSNHNFIVRGACYLYWNKPLMRFEATAETIFRSLSFEYLFFESADTYIVPSSTGMYMWYLLPFYVVGIYALIRGRSWTMIFIILVSLIIPASAAKVTIYRNVAGLYFLFFIIAAGVYACQDFFRHNFRKLLLPLSILFITAAGFYQLKYLTHYFFVYSRSTASMWSADAEFIARYIADNEYRYRTIIDHSAGEFGPLYYAFYTSYDPSLLLVRAERTSGNPQGWTHIGKIGNISSMDRRTIENVLCEKASAPQDTLGTLYITAPLEDYSRFTDVTTKDWRGSKVIHEIYDIDSLFAKLMADNPANLLRLCPLQVKNWK